jgi:hypothetical protein
LLCATVGGGRLNKAEADYATIAGGGPSDLGDPETTNNIVYDNYGTIGGGGWNRAGSAGGGTQDATYATVGGGYSNRAEAAEATVGGGRSNTASGERATLGGGYGNQATQHCATSAGGLNNDATGARSTVPGGQLNGAYGDYSFAAGYGARANNKGTFAWADSTGPYFHVNSDNQFAARASGGVYFYTKSDLSTYAYLPAGSGSWVDGSDRNIKADIEAIEPKAVLHKLAAVPISTWRYKGEDEAVRHMGPMAQDLYAAFGLGVDDKGISTIDADGVALAAIQGLHAIVREREAQLADMAARLDEKDGEIAELKQRLDQLEALIARLALAKTENQK